MSTRPHVHAFKLEALSWNRVIGGRCDTRRQVLTSSVTGDLTEDQFINRQAPGTLRWAPGAVHHGATS